MGGMVAKRVLVGRGVRVGFGVFVCVGLLEGVEVGIVGIGDSVVGEFKGNDS
jgi:hypothetical protein